VVQTAWQHISSELIVKGVKRCCIFNAKDETSGGTLWNGTKNEGKVRSQYEEYKGTECEDKESDNDW
jgi:hypothetical protein